MSLLCIAAVRRRVIPLWLGVMVAVVGGVGPFAGSIGFIVDERRAAGRMAARTRYGLEPAMAVNTDGRSGHAGDGRLGLRGHHPGVAQAGGRQVAEDETLVEISTDKVDAEVPAPAAGTVVKIHAAEGDTVERRRRARRDRARTAAPRADAPTRAPRPRPPAAEASPSRAPARPDASTIAMPAMGESVSEGTILEWAKQPGDAVEADETIVEISTDKVDAEVPAPAAGTLDRDPRRRPATPSTSARSSRA